MLLDRIGTATQSKIKTINSALRHDVTCPAIASSSHWFSSSPSSSCPVGVSVIRLLFLLLLLFSFLLGSGVDGVAFQNIPSCLEGRERCRQEETCRTLLGSAEAVCGPTPYTCKESMREQCSALLSNLQFHLFFRNCICDPLDAGECMEFQRNIFLHSCLSHEGAANISWIIPTASEFEEEEDDDDGLGAEVTFEDLEERQASCIGAWKSCQGRPRCLEVVQKFRVDCRDNRKAKRCLAADWSSCYSAINGLFGEAPEVVSCQCHVKRQPIREKCTKVRSKIVGNVCMETIPHFYQTSLLPEMPFHQQRKLLYKTATSDHQGKPSDRNRNCVESFRRCNEDHHCSAYLESYLNSCSWDATNFQCHKSQCLLQIKNFHSKVKSELTSAMLFCSCSTNVGDSAKAELCRSLRKLLLPTCSRMELPPPTCSGLVDRCLAGEECRKSWINFIKHCAPDGTSKAPASFCRLTEGCTSALVSLLGGPLTTNCTCPTHLSSNETSRCLEHKKLLLARDVCLLDPVGNFHISNFTTTSQLDSQNHVIDDVNVTSSQEFRDGVNLGCQRLPTSRHPSLISKPQYLRRYIGDANDCSVVCACSTSSSSSSHSPLMNQYTCLPLTCLPTEVCRIGEGAHVHNSMKVLPDRGLCRCNRGEMVCTKSHSRLDVKEGLFLHAGFSKHERAQLSEQTPIRFEHVTAKLNLLLQQQQQYSREDCHLSLLTSSETNFVFEVIASHEPITSIPSFHLCMIPAKSLSNLINSHHFSISEDAELSILKVAQLEKVQFHNHNSRIDHDQQLQQHQQSLQRSRFYDFFGESLAVRSRSVSLFTATASACALVSIR